jgi:hypothetical protein
MLARRFLDVFLALQGTNWHANQTFKQLNSPVPALQCSHALEKHKCYFEDACTCCAVVIIIRAGPLLTTSNAVIYNGDGNVVKLRGIGWFGFNTG